MESPLTGSRKRAIDELLKGKDSLIQLKIWLQEQHLGSHDGSDSSSTKELVDGIGRSFTTVISMLNPDGKESDQNISDSTLDRKSNISDVTSKPPQVKDRRGCYKRRKSEDSYQNVSSTVEDGYAWRKYGQKDILNSNFPRCYYRCTHKNDQGCKAIKQIQKLQDEPLQYKTMYFGRHTCLATSMSPNSFNSVLAYKVDHPGQSCQFVSFESHNLITDHPTSKHAAINFNLPVKEEVKEETLSGLCEEPVDQSAVWGDFAQIDSWSSSRNKTTDGLGLDLSQNVFSSSNNYSFSDFNYDTFDQFDDITNYFRLQ